MIKLDASSTISRLSSVADYAKMHDELSHNIQKAVDKIKDATVQNMRSSGYAVDKPIKVRGTNYPSLTRQVVAEVSTDALEGRVRIAPATRKNYVLSTFKQVGPLWFELGTEVRHKKGKGYTEKANSNRKQGGSRRHRNKGAETGKLTEQDWLENAVNESKASAETELLSDLDNLFKRLWNK